MGSGSGIQMITDFLLRDTTQLVNLLSIYELLISVYDAFCS